MSTNPPTEDKGLILPDMWFPGPDAEGTEAGTMIRQNPQLHSLDWLNYVKDPDWLIDYLLPKDQDGIVFADGGAGKTTLLWEWAWHVAAGADEWWDWGVNSDPGRKVMYVITEGYLNPKITTAGIRRRYPGLEPDPNDLVIMKSGLSVDHEANHNLEAWEKAVTDDNYQLIVVDTLSRTSGNLDENKQMDAAIYMRFWSTLREAARKAHGEAPTVVLVHHTTKDSGNIRGSSVLRNSVDFATKLTLRKQGDLKITRVTCDRHKAGIEFSPWEFTLDWVERDGKKYDPVVGNVTQDRDKPKGELSKAHRDHQLSKLFLDHYGEEGATFSDVKSAKKEFGISPGDVNTLRERLDNHPDLRKAGDRYYHTEWYD